MGEALDIAIVGAGAAGLMASIFAGRASTPPLRVAALDGAAAIGAKILVAGGGRCNVTHDVIHPADFNSTEPRRVDNVLKTFGVPATIEFFAALGVTLKREPTGKLFPTTDRAQTVLDALLRALDESGASLLPGHRVTAVTKHACGFSLTTSQGLLQTKALILATGGKSLPKTGSDGLGYDLARALGHSVTPTTPALVPLVLPEKHWLTALTGLSAEVELSLATHTGKIVRRQRGPMLLTHFGLSGPAVMDISRHWIALHPTDPACQLTANLLPDHDFAAVDQLLQQAATQRPRITVVTIASAWIPTRFAAALVQHIDIGSTTTMSQLTKPARRALAHALTALPLPVVRDRGYLFAEVTAGGVPLAEIDPATMASRVCPGLYLCGEVLDVDGRIGGYNFQWAWASGRLAGMSAASHLQLQTPNPKL